MPFPPLSRRKATGDAGARRVGYAPPSPPAPPPLPLSTCALAACLALLKTGAPGGPLGPGRGVLIENLAGPPERPDDGLRRW